MKIEIKLNEFEEKIRITSEDKFEKGVMLMEQFDVFCDTMARRHGFTREYLVNKNKKILNYIKSKYLIHKK